MEKLEIKHELAPQLAAFWKRECELFAVSHRDRRLVGHFAVVGGSRDDGAISDVPFGGHGVAVLADRYVNSLARVLRSAHGRFYTPPDLAAVLVRRAFAVPRPEGLIVDPGCGAGALLAAAVREIVAGAPTPEDALTTIAKSVRGVDTDGSAAAICELAIRVGLLPAWVQASDEARPSLPRFVTVGDGLADRRTAAMVLANPPFGRCSLDPDRRTLFADVLFGHAHWPTLFLRHAVGRLAPHGVAAFVMPASVVGGAYYQRLRAFLLEQAPPEWFGFVDARTGVFSGDVLQEALLATFVRGHRSGQVSVERIALDEERESHTFSIDSQGVTAPWFIPRRKEDVELLTRRGGRRWRLRDYGWTVSTGPLVWNRHKDQLSDQPDRGGIPIIWASDIRNGQVSATAPRARRFIRVQPGQEWLILDEPAVLVQRTTAPEQQRRLVVAVLDDVTLARLGGRVVVENHVNVCKWSGDTALTPQRLASCLMSEEADRLYRCMTGSVAVSAFELQELPLPEPGMVDVMDMVA